MPWQAENLLQVLPTDKQNSHQKEHRCHLRTKWKEQRTNSCWCDIKILQLYVCRVHSTLPIEHCACSCNAIHLSISGFPSGLGNDLVTNVVVERTDATTRLWLVYDVIMYQCRYLKFKEQGANPSYTCKKSKWIQKPWKHEGTKILQGSCSWTRTR